MTKTRVLIIDDDKAIRGLISLLITSMGHDVVGEAPNGAEGVELFKSTQPDLVLLDIEMPVMDGLEALKIIMKIDETAHIAILTAVDHIMIHEDAHTSGAKCYIRKDTKPEALKARLLEEITKVSTG